MQAAVSRTTAMLAARRRLGIVRAAALILLLQSCSRSVAAQKKMPGHSIFAPPNINDLSSNWFLGGTVIPTTKSLVLTPGVPGRVGMIWSPHPILTNDFEVMLKFSIREPSQARTATEEGLAFWYVYENATDALYNVTWEQVQNQDAIIANTWPLALEAKGLKLIGYRSMFNGVGVFLTGDKEGNAVVSAIRNDGQKHVTFADDLPVSNALKIDRRKDVTLRIRVQPHEVKVEILGEQQTASSLSLQGEFQPGGYLGITSFGGKKGSPEASERSDFVQLWSLDTQNYDAKADGEKMPQSVASATIMPKRDDDILRESSSFKDHRAESDAIKELTNMVFKLIVETQPQRQQLASAITSLGKRITAMEETFEHLKAEIDKKTGHHLGKEFDAIKQELISLSTVASKESTERHKKIESLHEDIADVHKSASSSDTIDTHLNKLTESNQRTMDSLTSEHQRMFGVSIGAIAFVIIAGLSLYNKFRCWEKKHIL